MVFSFSPKMESVFIKCIGKSVINGNLFHLHHDMFLFLIPILVFVSRILVRALWHFNEQTNPIPQRIGHGTTTKNSSVSVSLWRQPLFTLTYPLNFLFYGLIDAECAGNAQGAGAVDEATLRNTIREALAEPCPTSYASVERRVGEFLSHFGGSRNPSKSFLNSSLEEIKLFDSSVETRAQILVLIAEIKQEHGEGALTSGQAKDLLVLKLDKWLISEGKRGLFV